MGQALVQMLSIPKIKARCLGPQGTQRPPASPSTWCTTSDVSFLCETSVWIHWSIRSTTGVPVCRGRCNKNTTDKVTWQKFIFLQFWRLRIWDQGPGVGRVLGGDPLPGWQVAAFALHPPVAETVTSFSLLMRPLSPSWGSYPHDLM